MRRGPQKGSKFCDLLEALKFLNMFKRKPRNVYHLYHSSLHFDTKKSTVTSDTASKQTCYKSTTSKKQSSFQQNITDSHRKEETS